jgi:putative tryptophan/tyrosine transport system substrate-binding protein
MRRRALLFGMAGAAASPLAAFAQAKPVPTVGFLAPGSAGSARLLDGFKAAMRGLGYADGQNVRIASRAGDDTPASLSRLAEGLVADKVDVIVCLFTPAVRAAKQATSTIPIVMAGAGDPVATGLVESLGRPGGNITGAASFTPELTAKNIELLRELLPNARRLVALCNEADVFHVVFAKQILDAAPRQNFDVQTLMTTPAQLEADFARIRAQADAAIVQPSLPLPLCARLALEAKLPTAAPSDRFSTAGGLLDYCAVMSDQLQRAADYVDRILKGSKPGDLPIQQPTRFELSINLKTAKAIGVTVPQAILARADNVIE